MKQIAQNYRSGELTLLEVPVPAAAWTPCPWWPAVAACATCGGPSGS